MLLRLGLRPGPHWEISQRSPVLLAGLDRKGKGVRKGMEGEGRKREAVEGERGLTPQTVS